MYFVLSNNQIWQGLGLVLFEQLLMFIGLMSLFVILSYHGYGDPYSEEEGEVLSVGDAAFANRQAFTGGETRLCHYRLRWGGEVSHTI